MKEIRDPFTNTLLGILDNCDNFEKGLKFYGSDEAFIQVGSFRYDSGKCLRDHKHLENPRTASRTNEILIVLSGSCEIRIYNEKDALVCMGILNAGSFYIYYGGGVGYTITKDDTRILEIKNGPFPATDYDKERKLLGKYDRAD